MNGTNTGKIFKTHKRNILGAKGKCLDCGRAISILPYFYIIYYCSTTQLDVALWTSCSRQQLTIQGSGFYRSSIQKPTIPLVHRLLVLIPKAVAWLRCYHALQERVPKRWALSYHYLTNPFGNYFHFFLCYICYALLYLPSSKGLYG